MRSESANKDAPNAALPPQLQVLFHHLDMEEAALVEMKQFMELLLKERGGSSQQRGYQSKMRKLSEQTTTLATQRRRIIGSLAAGLGCPPEEVTLSRLIPRLGDAAAPLVAAQRRLQRRAVEVSQRRDLLQWMNQQTQEIAAAVLQHASGTTVERGYDAAGRVKMSAMY